MDLNERLAKYLDNLEVVAGKAAGFAEAEIPLVIQEWLQWQFYSGLAIAIASGLATLVLCVIIFACTARMRKPNLSNQEDITLFLVSLFSGVFLFVSVAGFVAGSGRAAKTYFAPRYVVIEEIHRLANK